MFSAKLPWIVWSVCQLSYAYLPCLCNGSMLEESSAVEQDNTKWPFPSDLSKYIWPFAFLTSRSGIDGKTMFPLSPQGATGTKSLTKSDITDHSTDALPRTMLRPIGSIANNVFSGGSSCSNLQLDSHGRPLPDVHRDGILDGPRFDAYTTWVQMYSCRSGRSAGFSM